MMQSQALLVLKTGVNVFLTGEPGAGKTYTINRYVEYLRSHGVEVAITASTGIAATHIGGMTIHSWSGIGINKYLTKDDVRDIVKQSRITNKMLKTSVLIIDEISMLDASTLMCVDLVCRAARKKDEPFGGMQVVFVGDFFQLPPVTREGEPLAQFAFQSKAWEMASPRVCYLTEHHRQEDQSFLRVLRGMRSGFLSDEEKDVLLSRMVDGQFSLQDLDAPKLFPHNMNVDRLNDHELANIPGKKYTFEMESHGAPPLVEQLKRGCLSPEMLTLKKGAQVMFTKNSFTEKYVNGTIGIVMGFAEETHYPIVQTRGGDEIEVVPTTWSIRSEERELASIVQLPLRLAWAMTVHKSQGMSLDAAFVDLSNAFVPGQGYVALSRVRSLDGLHLGGLNARAMEVNQDVLMKDAEFRRESFEAEELLSVLSEDDLRKKHDQFLEECGGDVQTKEPKNPSKKTKTPKTKKEPKIPTREQTLSLVRLGMMPEQIAMVRGIKMSTVLNHLHELLETKMCSMEDLSYIRLEYRDVMELILGELRQQEEGRLQPVFEHFHGEFSYDMIRLAKLFL